MGEFHNFLCTLVDSLQAEKKRSLGMVCTSGVYMVARQSQGEAVGKTVGRPGSNNEGDV
jgi:hypothetical protein